MPEGGAAASGAGRAGAVSEETIGTLSDHLDKALQCLTDEFNAGRSGPSGLRAQAIAHVRYSIPLAHRLRADLEAARADAAAAKVDAQVYFEYLQNAVAEVERLEAARATEAELRARVERRDAVVKAAKAVIERYDVSVREVPIFADAQPGDHDNYEVAALRRLLTALDAQEPRT